VPQIAITLCCVFHVLLPPVQCSRVVLGIRCGQISSRDRSCQFLYNVTIYHLTIFAEGISSRLRNVNCPLPQKDICAPDQANRCCPTLNLADPQGLTSVRDQSFYVLELNVEYICERQSGD